MGGAASPPAARDAAPADAGESEAPRVSASVDALQLGRVTYAGARVDFPVSRRLSILPQVELLNVSPRTADDRHTLRPYVGGGIGLHPSDDLDFEMSVVYGPEVRGTTSIEGVLGASKSFGADPEKDVPPSVEATAEIAATHISWTDGAGPAGPEIWQTSLALEAAFHLGHFELTPKGMGFLYDRSLASAQGERLEGLPVLARVGTYAPRALFGARFGYQIADGFVPFVDAEEILYVAGVGDANRFIGGAKVKFARQSHVLAAGGVLANRTSGALAVPGDPSVLPVVLAQLDVEF